MLERRGIDANVRRADRVCRATLGQELRLQCITCRKLRIELTLPSRRHRCVAAVHPGLEPIGVHVVHERNVRMSRTQKRQQVQSNLRMAQQHNIDLTRRNQPVDVCWRRRRWHDGVHMMNIRCDRAYLLQAPVGTPPFGRAGGDRVPGRRQTRQQIGVERGVASHWKALEQHQYTKPAGRSQSRAKIRWRHTRELLQRNE